MKTYKIDEELVKEILIMFENYRDDLSCSGIASNYVSFKRWEIRKLQRKLRNLERVKHFERVINKLKELKMKEFLPVVFLFVIPSVVMVLGLIAFLWCICK